jgi:predicted SAM-dependent methyltransferase
MAINLQIGTGANRMPPPWVNCDLYPGPAVDVVFDLQQPWPFADQSVHYIYGSHVLEHLHETDTFFREAWRVCEDGGTMLLRTPYGAHRAAWWDLTHVRPWFGESFAHLQPGYDQAIHNPQHVAAQATPWQVDYTQMRVSGELRRWLRWKWQRRLFLPWLQYLTDVVEELFVQLTALKSAASVAGFQAHLQRIAGGPSAACVPAQYVMWRHEFEGRALAPGEPLGFRHLGIGVAAAAYVTKKRR